MKYKLFYILIILMLVGLIPIKGSAKGLNVKGEVSSGLEIGLKKGKVLQTKNTLKLDFNYYSPGSGLTRAILDISNQDGDVLNLKEVFTELYLESTDLKIGKQRIAWGKADGINPTDYFNPEDLHEPFAEDNKIAVPAVRAKHYYQDWMFDLVWIPQFTAPRFAEAGDRWATLPTGKIEPVLPDTRLENSEFGIRASKWTPEVDFSFSIFRGFSKDSVFPDEPSEKDGKKIWQPEFYRVTALGGDFARDFGSFVFRGEGACFIPDNKYKEFKNPYYQIVFGVDKDLTDKIYINTQYYREKEEDREPLQMLTFSTEYEITAFKNIELNGSYIWDKGDFVFNPVYKVDVMDNVTVSIGAYILDGDRGTTYGTYADKDYCYIELQRSF